jgi:hypothetical protein
MPDLHQHDAVEQHCLKIIPTIFSISQLKSFCSGNGKHQKVILKICPNCIEYPKLHCKQMIRHRGFFICNFFAML